MNRAGERSTGAAIAAASVANSQVMVSARTRDSRAVSAKSTVLDAIDAVPMDTVRRRRPRLMQGISLRQPQPANAAAPSDVALVMTYHERTKHRPERYAPGPEALDWSSQPDPFRCFAGAPTRALPLLADHLTTPYSWLQQPHAIRPQPLTRESIGLLFELSLGISAWKEYGPDRWALRCNPSSGNLHPTEGYLVSRAIPGLADGLFHYLSRDHVLERRCESPTEVGAGAQAVLGLSSIHWREAWKYGERAFRYCQLDVGHALGALRYAAATLGWRLRLIEGVSWQQMAHRLGLDRAQDFSGAEPEEAELLLEVTADHSGHSTGSRPPELSNDASVGAVWTGRANPLDPSPMYHWPLIDEVAEATRPPELAGDPAIVAESDPPRTCPSGTAAATLIRQRRSAQGFDKSFEMARPEFFSLLHALLPGPIPPWDVWTFSPRLHLVCLVHRVEGLAAGLYVLPRRAGACEKLRAGMRRDFNWSKPPGCPDHLPFFQLAAGNCFSLARTLHCHQAIASDSAFALGMLAEFEDTLTAAPWRYRQLHWEAGLLGHAIYLEAEALGLRGTGIGCYFDDAFHELLGLSDRALQSLYHFTVGSPLTDARIMTLPPYPRRR